MRHTASFGPASASNPVAYAVDALPECDAIPSSAALDAQDVTLPRIINGRISHPGDTGVFRFQGKAGEEVAAEVCARRLGSPLDSLLRLADAAGRVLAWNDDCEDKGEGLLTEQTDSYLRVKLPADGPYYVYLTDAQNAGGEAHAYRLRLSEPQPDFALRLTPSGINVGAGRRAVVTVHALRKDGFDGEIAVSLKDAPDGFALTGARIRAGFRAHDPVSAGQRPRSARAAPARRPRHDIRQAGRPAGRPRRRPDAGIRLPPPGARAGTPCFCHRRRAAGSRSRHWPRRCLSASPPAAKRICPSAGCRARRLKMSSSSSMIRPRGSRSQAPPPRLRFAAPALRRPERGRVCAYAAGRR